MTTETRLTGAEVVAERLREHGVRHAFGIISIHNMPIIDAINRLGFTRMIDSRHESGAAHAADGYARATGELGVMIASTGPGTTNTVTGLYEAGYANSRLLVITGQAETRYYGKGAGYVHEAENQLPMLASVARQVCGPLVVMSPGLMPSPTENTSAGPVVTKLRPAAAAANTESAVTSPSTRT